MADLTWEQHAGRACVHCRRQLTVDARVALRVEDGGRSWPLYEGPCCGRCERCGSREGLVLVRVAPTVDSGPYACPAHAEEPAVPMAGAGARGE
ncbi:hypothetical protein [Streptomyces termitum]|uniref:hypothetical protein n=1 Tax=Streptomyces termitum TaxID=67368 RepID=UPI0033A11F86